MRLQGRAAYRSPVNEFRSILAQPEKDNLEKIVDQLKFTNQVKKMQLQSELRQKNFKFLTELNKVYEVLLERQAEELKEGSDADSANSKRLE